MINVVCSVLGVVVFLTIFIQLALQVGSLGERAMKLEIVCCVCERI